MSCVCCQLSWTWSLFGVNKKMASFVLLVFSFLLLKTRGENVVPITGAFFLISESCAVVA